MPEIEDPATEGETETSTSPGASTVSGEKAVSPFDGEVKEDVSRVMDHSVADANAGVPEGER